MYYINKHFLVKKRDLVLLHLLPSVVVFIASFSVTLTSWSAAKNNVKDEQRQMLQSMNTDTASFIKQRMDAYEEILRGTTGLFYANNLSIDQASWTTFLNNYKIQERFPGVQAIGYTKVIPKEQLQNHIEEIRASGDPAYTVFPEGERDVYTSIMYSTNFSGNTSVAKGYDMYSDITRKTAMDKAKDTNQAAISDLVTLLQDQNREDKQPGFLMYFPLYNSVSGGNNEAERAKNIYGYVYAPFRSYDLINRTFVDQNNNYAFQIVSDTGSNNTLLYKSDNYEKIRQEDATSKVSSELIVKGKTWEITGIVSPSILSEDTQNRPRSILWGGILFSFFVTGFIYLLLANRSRVLAAKEERGLQDAKDELLALASHQLRTPATGVKQYVGMLREGMAGKLTKLQLQLLDKAHESNERQLSTINEMLFVARADARQLKMEHEPVDLKALTIDIVDEQKGTIERRLQTYTLTLPKKAVVVQGDKHYLRMALENIISNATKYTHERGNLDISLKADDHYGIFTVTDNGVGVGDEDLPLLFKKFSRIPNELTGKVSGSGIGLYLAKKVIDTHKGSISFKSEQGIGSEVIVRIHLAPKSRSTKKTNRK